MIKSIRFKYVFSFLVIAVVAITLLNTYGHKVIYNMLLEHEKQKLYEEAKLVTKDYLPSISILDMKNDPLRRHLSSVGNMTDMRIWLVSPSGSIIMDSQQIKPCQGMNIKIYDSSFLSSQSVVGIRPKKLITEETVSIIYPITELLNAKGYVVLMSPLDDIATSATNYTNLLLLCGIILLAIAAILFLYLYLQTAAPMKKITAATKKYADGQFQIPVPKLSSKEQKELFHAIWCLAEQMKGQNEYQKNFIANVSHDFRSPLTSIKGYTEALADGTISTEMQEKYFNIILFEIERLNKLTSNILELNQLDYGSMILEQTDFDINNIVKTTSALFEQRCTAKHIVIELLFDQPELSVYGDAARIQQVIQNLLDNAVKFSPDNSTIVVQTMEKTHKVFVSIKDHGIGIPKENQAKIWNRFYKTDLSRGKDKTGTGLGLSITKEIIEAHGENINVISTPGIGTEFIFSLPKSAPAPLVR